MSGIKFWMVAEMLMHFEPLAWPKLQVKRQKGCSQQFLASPCILEGRSIKNTKINFEFWIVAEIFIHFFIYEGVLGTPEAALYTYSKMTGVLETSTVALGTFMKMTGSLKQV